MPSNHAEGRSPLQRLSRADPVRVRLARIITPPLALTRGTRLGVYEIVASIGAGGMGEVYRAKDTKLDREVAIKVLPESFASDPDRLMRFTREAKTLAALNHPNIGQIYGIESDALVMELVEGEDLSQQIARGPIVLPDALPIAKQIAEALEAAHEQGIIHRDLKPANIKVRADGTVKVLDFGLAKAMDPAGASNRSASALANSPTITSPAMTQMGMILGTAAYMSPEQARGRAVDRRADIWAFGCVLFEMLTGRRAFPGEDITDTLAAVVRGEPDWTLIPVSLSPTLLVFLKRCLQKDPKQRIGDIHDVRLALDGAFDPAVLQTASAAPAVPRRHVREYVAWGLATVATLVAIGAALLYLRAPRQADTLVRFSVAPPADVVRPRDAGFAVTPDGQTIAFVARGADGVPHIFVRRLDAADAQVVAGTDRAQASLLGPRWPVAGLRQRGRPLSRRARRERSASAVQRARRFVCGRYLERPRRDRLCSRREWTVAGARHGRRADAGDDAGRRGEGSRAPMAVVSSGWPARAVSGAARGTNARHHLGDRH